MKFIQIGKTVIAVDYITSIFFDHQRKIATVYLASYEPNEGWMEFRLNEYELFFKWWSDQTDVEVLS